jgi:hypothetical protein
MPQTFSPQAVLAVKVTAIVFAFASIAALATGVSWTSRHEIATNAVSVQPIPFSHKHHVGDVGLDCRACHVTVEKSAAPGMPSAQLCLTCHSQLFADQALLAPLRRSVASGQPIGWTHVNHLPDYVYFDHSVHLAKGVACIECHGRVDQMPLVSRPQELHMKWCFGCHENPAPNLHRTDQVFAMPPRAQGDEQFAQRLASKLEPRQRMTDCSTCHR